MNDIIIIDGIAYIRKDRLSGYRLKTELQPSLTERKRFIGISVKQEMADELLTLFKIKHSLAFPMYSELAREMFRIAISTKLKLKTKTKSKKG